MNDKRKIELLQKQNNRLIQQLEIYKSSMEKLSVDSFNDTSVQQYLNELETIQTEWLESLGRLQKAESQYCDLIQTVTDTVKELKEIKKKLSWTAKLNYKIQNKLFKTNNDK